MNLRSIEQGFLDVTWHTEQEQVGICFWHIGVWLMAELELVFLWVYWE
jgi:hypothetical protein